MAIPIEIDVWQGEIAELEVDAILVPADETLFMTTAVGRAVKRRAGEAVERNAVALGPVQAGSAVVTPGGELAAPYLIHVVGVGHDLRADEQRLERALDDAFEQAGRLGLMRLASSPIGTERGVFDVLHAASALARVLERRASSEASLPSTLVVAVGNAAEAAAYRSAVMALGAGR